MYHGNNKMRYTFAENEIGRYKVEVVVRHHVVLFED